jgi:MFS transporter, CP family, cyanate transporter
VTEANPHRAGETARTPLPALIPTALALFLVGLALRPQLVAIGPLLPQIQADLDVSHAVGGLLGTIPVLCMGVFALLGPWVARRFGAERAIAGGVAAIAAFGLARAFAPDAATVLLLTFGLGVGVAVTGPLVPIVVRERRPDRAATLTGAHAGGIVLGATLAAGLAVPLAGPDLDWRWPLAVFAVAAAVLLVVWVVLERPAAAPSQPVDVAPPRLPWMRRRAWALAAIFGTQSVLFYGVMAWLPTIYVERGWPELDAGFLLAVLNGVSLLTTFGAPIIAERFASRREHIFWSSVISLAGLLGIVLVPDLAFGWVVLLGVGLGAVFPLALTLPVHFAHRAREVGGLAAIMLFGGYTMASLAPFLLGLVRDATGSFDLSLWILVATAVALMASAWFFVPAGMGRHAARPE